MYVFRQAILYRLPFLGEQQIFQRVFASVRFFIDGPVKRTLILPFSSSEIRKSFSLREIAFSARSRESCWVFQAHQSLAPSALWLPHLTCLLPQSLFQKLLAAIISSAEPYQKRKLVTKNAVGDTPLCRSAHRFFRPKKSSSIVGAMSRQLAPMTKVAERLMCA